jgi:hypothetical protein
MSRKIGGLREYGDIFEGNPTEKRQGVGGKGWNILVEKFSPD